MKSVWSISCVSLFLFSLSVAPVYAGQLTVKDVKASSTAPESMGVSFSPTFMVDGKVGTFWGEGEASAGLGEWIEFRFDGEVTLSRIELYNGNWYSREYYDRHNRAKMIQVKFSTGTPEKWELVDKLEKQVLVLKTPVKTRSVRLVLKEIFPGNTYNDTYLSEILFFNEEPGGVLTQLKPKATSSLPADADASYTPERALDGITDTVWCEGKKDSGVGESITLTLPAPTALKELRVLPGVPVTSDTYAKNGRPTKLKVELDGKTSVEGTLTDTFNTWSAVGLEGAKASTVKLTVIEAAAGTSFNDTCIAELQLVPAGG